MLPKISFVYDRKHNRKVEACIYYAGKRRYIATGITVPENATYSNGIISGCSTAPSLNKVLTTSMNILLGQLQEQVAKDKFDLSAFSLSLTYNTDSFVEWALSRCETLHLRDNTKKSYRNAIERFSENGIVRFSDLTTEKIQKAVDSMRSVISPATLRGYHSILISFVKAAKTARFINVMPDGATLPKGKSKEICYLTREELALVENVELSGQTADARDMFLFACYTGLAYSDLTKITKSDIIMNGGKPYIIDRRQKTDSRYKLRIMPKAMEILKRHNYNLRIMNNNVANHELAKVEKKIDTALKSEDKNAAFNKHLSMHVGRHTFATLALSSGVRIETVSRMLAHSDIKTTQIYAKVLQKDVDEGFDILEEKL